MIDKLLGYLGRCLLVLSYVYLGFNMLTDPDFYLPSLTYITSGFAIQSFILSQARVVTSITAICIVMGSFLTVLRVRTGVTMLVAVELFHLLVLQETVPVIMRLCTVGALLLV
jgi:hypothetical protein